MKIKKYYLAEHSYWRPDNDFIILVNCNHILKLNQRSGFIFIHRYVYEKNDLSFFENNQINALEIQDLNSLLLSNGFLSEKKNTASLNRLPHILTDL